MTSTAILLITLSAFAHAFWNLLGKRRNPTAAFFLAASLGALVCLSPVLVWHWQSILHIPGSVWLLLGGAGITQAMYMIGLAGAYRNGDMSVAYPLVRAIPVILIAIVGSLLRLGKPISLQ